MTTAPAVVSQPSAINSENVDELTVVITIPYIDESLGEMR